MSWVFPTILGYLIGSVPLGLLIATFFGETRVQSKKDLLPAGNMAPLHLLQTGSPILCVGTFMAECGKILLVYTLFYTYSHNPDIGAVAALAAAVGHMRPLYLKFRPHRSVVPLIALCLALHPLTGLLLSGMWLILARLTERPYTTTVLVALLAPTLTILLAPTSMKSVYVLAAASLLLFHLRHTLANLYPNTEPRVRLF